MKTAEEWANQGFSFGADTKTDFVELLKSIQLDARIAGLREAAEIQLGVNSTNHKNSCLCTECHYRRTILSRAAQLENHLLVFETLRWNVSLLSLRIARQIRRSDD